MLEEEKGAGAKDAAVLDRVPDRELMEELLRREGESRPVMRRLKDKMDLIVEKNVRHGHFSFLVTGRIINSRGDREIIIQDGTWHRIVVGREEI